jgi:hypothetical protein
MMALTLRRTWPDSPHRKEDWLVLDDGVVVGRIYENESAPRPGSSWYWALNSAAGEALQHGIRGSGLAPSLEAAKEAWRESYDKWRDISGSLAKSTTQRSPGQIPPRRDERRSSRVVHKSGAHGVPAKGSATHSANIPHVAARCL